MKSKKSLLLILILVMTLLLSGCQEESTIATEDGEIITYTKEEATEKGGFFIKKGEDQFQQLLQAGIGDSVGTYVWYTNFDNLIPEVKSENDAVVYISKDERPNMYEFIEMRDMGYTLGVAFESNIVETVDGKEEKEFTFNDSLYNPFSPAKPYLDNYVDSNYQSIKITEVNGREFKETMLTPEGFMKGLTKNAMYKFWFYKGTQYDSVSLMADSRLFIENMSYYSKNHEEKKDVFFEVDIPEEMPNGYFIIPGEGGGMFKYEVPIKKD